MGTRQSRPVTFRCDYCGQAVTELRAPGPLPRYCTPCAPEAQKAMNRLRVRAYRERTQPHTGWERPRGRPRKD